MLPRRHPHGRSADAGAAGVASAGRGSTSASSPRGRSGPATRSSRWAPARRRSRSPRSTDCCTCPAMPASELRRALRVPALSQGWQASFQAMLDQGDDSGAGNAGLRRERRRPRGRGSGPRRRRIDRESDSVVSVHLADPDGASLPAALPGQYLTLRLQPASPAAAAAAELLALGAARRGRLPDQRQARGARRGQRRTCTTRRASGDRLEVAAPRGTFTLRPGDAPVLLISAGVGATPVLAMLHALAADRSDAGGLVAPRRPQRRRAPVRRGGAVAARGAAQRAPARLLQPPRPGDTEGRRLRRRGGSRSRARRARAAARRGGVPLRPVGFMRRGRRRRSPRLGIDAAPHPHRAVRRRTLPDARHRSRAAAAAAPARRATRRRARWSRSPAATSPCAGAAATPACSSWPKRATCPCAGRAAPASATTARRPRLRRRRPTPPSPSTARRRATRSSAARGRRTTSSSTSEPGAAGWRSTAVWDGPST